MIAIGVALGLGRDLGFDAGRVLRGPDQVPVIGTERFTLDLPARRKLDCHCALRRRGLDAAAPFRNGGLAHAQRSGKFGRSSALSLDIALEVRFHVINVPPR